MIFYIYDEKTKEYTGTQNAFIDPLETKKRGKNVYLLPRNATYQKPLETKENQAVIFNGSEWELIADYRGKTYYVGTEQHEMKELGDLPKGATFEPVEPEKTLEELKEKKLDELTAAGHQFDNQLVNEAMIIKSSLGFKVNADLRSQNNLRGLIAVGVEPVNFVTADNSVRSLSLEQLNVLLNEAIKNGEKLYETKWKYRDMILNSSSTEELNAIEFKFTMSDFSVSQHKCLLKLEW